MARNIQTIQTDGASSALTTSDVANIVKANVEWEFISNTKNTSEVSFLVNTFDTTVYSGIKIVVIGGKGTAESYYGPWFRATTSGGIEIESGYSYEYFRWGVNNSSSASTSGTYIYMPSSMYQGSTSNAYLEYEISVLNDANSAASITIRIASSNAGGYWGSEGTSYVSAANIGGIKYGGFSGLSDSRIMVFGRRKR